MKRANGTCRCPNGSSNIDVSSDLVAGILRVQVCTRWQSRRISARGKGWDSGNGRLSAGFAALVSADMAQRACEQRELWCIVVAYDSGYDDDEDGWSVVGEVGRFGLQTEQTGLGYGLDGGRFAVLADYGQRGQRNVL